MDGFGGPRSFAYLVTDLAHDKVTVWDVPLRIWHWLFGAAVLTALATGLIEEIYDIQVHQWAGITVVSLLVFRLTWGIWGATYARWTKYWTTPRKFVDHFLRKGELTPHTAPGIVLVVILMIAALVQSATGLFMTDDIFFEGPLHDYVDEATFDWIYLLHHNAWRFVAVAVGVHLLAQLIYGVVLRDLTPLSMITGQKRVALPTVSTPWIRALFSLAMSVVTFLVLALLAD